MNFQCKFECNLSALFLACSVMVGAQAQESSVAAVPIDTKAAEATANNIPASDSTTASSLTVGEKTALPKIDYVTTYVTTSEGRNPDKTLRIVNPSARTTDVALMVVGALLGSFRTPVDKDHYKGDHIETVPHPADNVMRDALAPVVGQWLVEHPQRTAFKNPIQLRPDTFALVYDKYDELPEYRLKLQTTVARKADSAGWLTAPVTVTCTSDFAESLHKMDEWAADDYAMVKAKEAEHAQACAKQVQASLDKMLAP